MTVEDSAASECLPHAVVKDPTTIKSTNGPPRSLVSPSNLAPAGETRPEKPRWDLDTCVCEGTQSNEYDKKPDVLGVPVRNNSSPGWSPKLSPRPPKESSSGLDNLALAAVAVSRPDHASLGVPWHNAEPPRMHPTDSARVYAPTPRESNVSAGQNSGNKLAPIVYLPAEPIAELPGLFSQPWRLSHLGKKGAANVTVHSAVGTDVKPFRMPSLADLGLPRPPLHNPPTHGVAFYYGGSPEGASDCEMAKHYQNHMNMNSGQYGMQPSGQQGLPHPDHPNGKCHSQESRDLPLPKGGEPRFTTQPANPTAPNNNSDPRNFQLKPRPQHQLPPAEGNRSSKHQLPAEKYQRYQNKLQELLELVHAAGRSSAPPQLQDLASIHGHHHPDRHQQPAHHHQSPPPHDPQPLSHHHHQQPPRDYHHPSVHYSYHQLDRHAASRSSAPPKLQSPVQDHNQQPDQQQPPAQLHHQPPAHHHPPQNNQPLVHQTPQQHEHCQCRPPSPYPPPQAPFQDTYRPLTHHHSQYPDRLQTPTHRRSRSDPLHDPLHDSRLERRRRTRSSSPPPYPIPLTHIIPASSNLHHALTAHDSFDAQLQANPPAQRILRTVTPAHYELSAQLRAKRAPMHPEPEEPPVRDTWYQHGPVAGKRSEREPVVQGVGEEELLLRLPWVRAISHGQLSFYATPARPDLHYHESYGSQRQEPPAPGFPRPWEDPQGRPYHPPQHQPPDDYRPKILGNGQQQPPTLHYPPPQGSIYQRHQQTAYSHPPRTPPSQRPPNPVQISQTPTLHSRQGIQNQRDPSGGQFHGRLLRVKEEPVEPWDGKGLDLAAILSTNNGTETQLKASPKADTTGQNKSAAEG